MNERRKNRRLNETLAVKHWPAGSICANTSVSKDISVGGIQFPILQRLEPGLELGLHIGVPGFKDPIKASGEVVWLKGIEDLSHRFAVGVKFTKIDTPDCGRFLFYMNKRLRETKKVNN